MASTAERIIKALREKPHTRPALLFIINDVTSRAVLYQLSNLVRHGFVRRSKERCSTYSLITEQGFLQTCNSCGKSVPCWQMKGPICQHCSNSSWLLSKNKLRRKEAMYAEDDACSRAYQRLLRGHQIGITNKQ